MRYLIILLFVTAIVISGCRDLLPAPVPDEGGAVSPTHQLASKAKQADPTTSPTLDSAVRAIPGAAPLATATPSSSAVLEIPPPQTATPSASAAAAIGSIVRLDTPTATDAPTRTPSPTRAATATITRTPTPRFTATPYPVPSGNISRIDTTFRSASLGMDSEIIIYLPPGYNSQSQRRYPVLYLLHGWGGFNLQHTTEWEQAGLMQGVQEAIVKGLVQPMIVVQPFSFLPNGDCSLYFNHGPGTDGKPWGDYIWKDVVNYVDSNYRTIAQRQSRAIGGFSFGGQGALSLGLTHPEVFAVVGAHSPSLRAADGSIASMNDPNWYDRFDPIWVVENSGSARQLAIWMDVAFGDDKVRECGPESDRCVEAFHTLLVEKGIPHEWHDQWPGPHELTYWQGHLDDYLTWYSAHLIGQ